LQTMMDVRHAPGFRSPASRRHQSLHLSGNQREAARSAHLTRQRNGASGSSGSAIGLSSSDVRKMSDDFPEKMVLSVLATISLKSFAGVCKFGAIYKE